MENTTVGDNYPAIKASQSYCNGTPLLTNLYFTQKDAGSITPVHGQIYIFKGPLFPRGYKNVNEEYNNLEKIFNQIISTFKFTTAK